MDQARTRPSPGPRTRHRPQPRLRLGYHWRLPRPHRLGPPRLARSGQRLSSSGRLNGDHYPGTAHAKPLPPWTTIVDGNRLRDMRRHHGMTQEQLADQAQVSLSALARLERQDRGRCRTWTLSRLAITLGEHHTAITPAPARALPRAAQAATPASATISRVSAETPSWPPPLPERPGPARPPPGS